VGTVDYMAPEQFASERVSARTDVYALGCVLFETLTGQVPYPRETTPAKMYAHINVPPPEVTAACPTCPPLLNSVVARAMAKDPLARYASAGDLAASTIAAAHGNVPMPSEQSVAVGDAALPTRAEDAPGHPYAATPTERRSRRWLRRLAFVGAACAAFAIAAVVTLLIENGSSTSTPSRHAAAQQANASHSSSSSSSSGSAPLPSYLTADQVRQLRTASYPVLYPETPPHDWQMPPTVQVPQDAASAQSDAVTQGGWVLDFTNGATAPDHASLIGAKIWATDPSTLPACSDQSAGTYGVGVQCSVFAARGVNINHSQGASGDSYFWTECGAGYQLFWRSGVSFADVQHLIDSLKVLPGTGKPGCS